MQCDWNHDECHGHEQEIYGMDHQRMDMAAMTMLDAGPFLLLCVCCGLVGGNTCLS